MPRPVRAGAILFIKARSGITEQPDILTDVHTGKARTNDSAKGDKNARTGATGSKNPVSS